MENSPRIWRRVVLLRENLQFSVLPHFPSVHRNNACPSRRHRVALNTAHTYWGFAMPSLDNKPIPFDQGPPANGLAFRHVYPTDKPSFSTLN